MDFKDYYATLGVSKTATDKEIKQAFRKLARKFHPDVNPGDKKAEGRFKEINEAHEVLSDAAKRRKYDELGANWRQYEQAGPRAGSREPFAGGARTMSPEEMESLFGGQNPFSDFFTTFFGGSAEEPARGRGTGARGRQRRGQDVEHEIELSLEEAFHGVTRRLGLKHAGHARTVDVRIPAGVGDGSRVRVTGEGEPGTSASGAGDLYLRVRLLPHPIFERRGRDIYVKVPVPVTLPVCGGEASVPTLSGKTVRLRIPPLTSAGQLFRLKGYGMPSVARPADTGDAYARLEVQLPTTLTPEARAHWDALARLQEGGATTDSAA